MELHNRRLIQADQYLNHIDADQTYKYFESLQKETHIDLAVGVVSVRRQHNNMRLDYLTQVMTRLMYLFNVDTAFQSKVLFICDTHAGPGKHDEALRLSKYVPIFQRFPNGNASFVIMDRFDKEKQDYAFCISKALEYHPRYVLIIEDDAVPRLDFFDVLYHILENYVQRKPRDDSHEVKYWAFVKLFYPQRWQGYSFELDRLMELVGIGILGGSIFLFTLLTCNKRRYRTITKVVFFVFTALYCIFCALSMGRQHILEIRRISKSLYRLLPAPNCCSPANVYPYDKALQLVRYLSHRTCSPMFPLDALLDEFVEVNNYRSHLVEPSLVKHIGMVSSLKSGSTNLKEFIF